MMKKLFAMLLMLMLCVGLAVTASAATITPVQPKGSGTETDPYLIGTAAELYWYAQNVNSNDTVRKSYAELTADITVNQGVLNADGSLSSNAVNFETWTPIGNAYKSAYTGHFDGKGHTVSGLYCVGDYETATYIGFFGSVGANAVIKNVTISDAYFSGKVAGGIAGQVSAAEATFENCHNKATVVAHAANNGGSAGGIIASTKQVTITGCSNAGMICINTKSSPVSLTSKAGGLVGSGNAFTIKDSYNTGSVTGVSYVGGLVGMGGGTFVIEKCYNTGTITGNPLENKNNTGIFIGGILGYHNSAKSSEIKDCYNAGSVTGADYVGGLAGAFTFPNDTIKNSHNFGSVNSNGSVVSGLGAVNPTTNCYYLNTLPKDENATAKTAEAFKDGSLVTLLNAGRAGADAVWTQGDTYPVFGKPVATYTIAFNSNGGSGTMIPQTFTAGVAQNLTLNTFFREGFTFIGWNTAADGSGNSFADGASISASSNAVLYAQWKAVPAVNPLTIIKQPADQFVVEGQRAEFSVEATGDGLTYQWYINRNDGRGWRELDGAIGSVYITSVTDLDCDSFQYGCLITDQYGNTLKSDVVVLHVSQVPVLPETGDSATPMLWLAMSILSMAGIMLLRKKAYSR